MDWVRGAIHWIPLIPLIGAVYNLLFGRKTPRPAIFAVACLSVFASFVLAVSAFLYLKSLPAVDRIVTEVWYPWISVGELKANAAFLLDPLSSVMILVVTGVGFLIHLYSIGYMGDDESAWRFFGLLNLFVFAMLVLVLADNLLLMFIGWEGVGLCSYLLIGFWYKEIPNTDAGKKAFIVNRIGDWAFLAGVLLLFWTVGERTGVWTVTFTELGAAIGGLSGATLGGMSVATVAAILLFIGATGKSAQIPLYVWLPDAMAGPTPVSALIHAATMVTAGVYMIGRVHFLYDMSPVALTVVASVGAATALFAATIGLVQNDIKKVLAYSTVSQLGYMFLGMGLGAYSAGIFHLMTHAFFKACLFLGAGSVILACHHQQDVRFMGGLRRWMPKTYQTFLVSTLAIAGIFPFSGFFSKDEILWQAWGGPHANRILWGVGALAAVMTAFYMFRLVYLTFHGDYRGHHGGGHEPAGAHQAAGHGHGGPDAHPKEQRFVITFPLQVLAFLALIAGFINMPTVLGGFVGWHESDAFHRWLQPSFATSAAVMPHRAALPPGRPTGAPTGAPTLAEAVKNAAQPEPHPASLAEAVKSAARPEPGPASLAEAVKAAGHTADEGAAAAGTAHATGPAALHADLPAAHAATGAAGEGEAHNPGLELLMMLVSLAVAVAGIITATTFYLRNPGIPQRLKERYQRLYTLLLNKYYVDEIYQAVFVDNLHRLKRLLGAFDNIVIDGLVNLSGRVTVLWSWVIGQFDNIVVDGWGVNGLARTFQASSRNLRQLQTGKVQGYLMVGLLGLLLIIVLRVL